MNLFVAVDPGIDAMGVAIFDIDAYDNRSDARSVGRALRVVTTIRTSPDEEIEERLRQLVLGLQSAMDAACGSVFGRNAKPYRVALERPAKAGSYARNADIGAERMAAPMAKLHFTIGAIAGAMHWVGVDVRFVPAPRLPKQQRHLLALDVWRLAGFTGRKPSADALDAIWLGASELTGDIAFERRRAAVHTTTSQAPQ